VRRVGFRAAGHTLERAAHSSVLSRGQVPALTVPLAGTSLLGCRQCVCASACLPRDLSASWQQA